MSLSLDVKSLLSSVSNVSIGDIPSAPDDVVVIFLTGGYDRSLSGREIEEPTFQIRVRSAGYLTGESLCNTVKDLLHGSSNSTILMIEQQGDTLDLGRDGQNRHEWSINFRAYYKR